MYNQRVIDVEKATFTTLVLSTHGGIGPYAEKFNNRLAYCMQRSLLKNEHSSIARLSRPSRLHISFVRTSIPRTVHADAMQIAVHAYAMQIAVRGFNSKQKR